MKREQPEIKGSPQLLRIAAIARSGLHTDQLLKKINSLAATVPESERKQAGWLVEGYIASWSAETEEGA